MEAAVTRLISAMNADSVQLLVMPLSYGAGHTPNIYEFAPAASHTERAGEGCADRDHLVMVL